MKKPPSHTQPVLIRRLSVVRMAGGKAQGQLEPGRGGGFPVVQKGSVWNLQTSENGPKSKSSILQNTLSAK